MATPLARLLVLFSAALFAGCASSAVPSSQSIATHVPARSTSLRLPVALSPEGMLRINSHAAHHYSSFDTCPKHRATLEYISDFANSVINIYRGKFVGQHPCGQISGNGISMPEGLFVKNGTHDLYVANTGGFDILVFHKGSTTPYATFTDPGAQYPVDVTVASDGTVIASNTYAVNGGENGSISTWLSNGTFVGNFPMINDVLGEFVTVQQNGTLYFNDVDMTSGLGLLWTGSCPLGACGTFTSTGATTTFPGGLRSADSEDVVQVDQQALLGGALITYESFPNGVSCSIGGGEPAGMDINKYQHDVVYADSINDVGGEIGYPSCAPVGIVPGNLGGLLVGAAIDVPAGL